MQIIRVVELAIADYPRKQGKERAYILRFSQTETILDSTRITRPLHFNSLETAKRKKSAVSTFSFLPSRARAKLSRANTYILVNTRGAENYSFWPQFFFLYTRKEFRSGEQNFFSRGARPRKTPTQFLFFLLLRARRAETSEQRIETDFTEMNIMPKVIVRRIGYCINFVINSRNRTSK